MLTMKRLRNYAGAALGTWERKRQRSCTPTSKSSLHPSHFPVYALPGDPWWKLRHKNTSQRWRSKLLLMTAWQDWEPATTLETHYAKILWANGKLFSLTAADAYWQNANTFQHLEHEATKITKTITLWSCSGKLVSHFFGGATARAPI